MLAALPGRVVALEGPTGLGLTRVGLGLLTPLAERLPVVVVDVRGWLCPLAGWEMGIPPEHLHVVRCPDRIEWPKVMAALLDGISGVYAEVPTGIPDQMLRRLAALARKCETTLVLRPLGWDLPAGTTYLRVRPIQVDWQGPDAGHGRLTVRRLYLELSGKGASGIRRTVELEDDGENFVRVVSGLAASPARRAAG